MKTLDLTKYGLQRVSFFLALEKYLLASPRWQKEELFFIWDKYPAIVCGKHQLIPAEVNMEVVQRLNVPIYRRHSGGGTIYADDGCFMFTFLKRSQQRNDVFRECLSHIERSFKLLNLDVYLSGRNDLMFREKKFSGNAYYRNEFGSVLHGTLLHHTNFEDMVRLITPDNDKLISKGIESVRQRVINMGDYMSLSKYELMCHLENSIAGERVCLTDEEFNKVSQMEAEYLSAEWMEGNNPPYTFSNKHRFDFGLIEARVDVKNDIIRNINLTGDFFTHKELTPIYETLQGVTFCSDAVRAALQPFRIEDFILGATIDNILELLFL